MKALAAFLFAAVLSAQTVKPALTEAQKDSVAFHSSIAYCQKNPSGTAWLYGSTYIHDWYSMPCADFLKLAKPVIDIRDAGARLRRAQTAKPALLPTQNVNRDTFNAHPDEYMVKPALPSPDKSQPPFAESYVGGSFTATPTLLVATVRTRSVAIYAQPKDSNILMEFFDEKNSLEFTVFVDGTVKAAKGADLDATTKAFWKSMADAFVGWKQSACQGEQQ